MTIQSLWNAPLRALSWLVFGNATFAEREEYQEFRYKLLTVLMTTGSLVTGLLVWGSLNGANPINVHHLHSMEIFTIAVTLLWVLLRNHPKRLQLIAWAYEILCLGEYVSSTVYVSEDELRLLWFFTNVPGVFILLGKWPGWVITLATVVGLVLGNSHLERPYSPNAMATSVFALFYLGVFFHTYVERAFSYFVRMRDYNARLQEMASHDALTQVLNARAYYENCDRLIAQCLRSELPFSVLFIDLDHFKSINDTYGHAAGDEVLRVVAHGLSGHLRHTDLLGRIGGEEFSIFLPDTPLDKALKLAEDLRVAIERSSPQVAEIRLKVTASVGVASNTHELRTIQAIQQNADAAMYQAKKAGRNRVSTLLALNSSPD
jgi:diguanylate cyclase (GGDEF)-like protein